MNNITDLIDAITDYLVTVHTEESTEDIRDAVERSLNASEGV